MKLNKLSYKIIEQNEESIKEGYFVDNEDFPGTLFELLIDGETISSLLKTKHKAIPYFYFENDLPKIQGEKEIYLICVCSCGIDDCGRVTCVLDKEKDFVTFRDIFDNKLKFLRDFEFRFSRENYASVIKEIVAKASEYNKNCESQNESHDEN